MVLEGEWKNDKLMNGKRTIHNWMGGIYMVNYYKDGKLHGECK